MFSVLMYLQKFCRDDQNHPIQLNFEQFKKFNHTFVSHYDKIVNDAPHSWKTDGFLLDNIPVGITCHYSQDATICAPDSHLTEVDDFAKECHWEHVRSFNIALATDLR